MIKVKIINKSKNDYPAYATSGSAGMDIRADFSRINTLNDMQTYGHCAYNTTYGFVIQPGARALIPTGIQIGLPDGYECQVRPRSGLALKHGITVLNSPGTVDSDYIGEIGVILINNGTAPFKIENGDRIAQIVIAKYEQCEWEPVDKLKKTERGEGAYNHTGVK